MPAKFTDITILLDDSASMSSTAHKTLESLRAFVREQQAVPGDAVLTLVKFHHRGHLNRVLEAYPLKSVSPESLAYRPAGGATALNDAWVTIMDERGKAFAALPESMRPEKVVFVVITDGFDNASYHSKQSVNEKVEHQRNAYKWQFIYLGANQDAEVVGEAYGVPKDFALTYDANFIREASCSVSGAIADYRTSDSHLLKAFTPLEKKRAKGE